MKVKKKTNPENIIKFIIGSNAIYLALLFAVMVVVFLIVYKTLYFSFDESTGKFVAYNLFFDDMGVRTSYVIMLDHYDSLKEQVWFKAFNNLGSFDILESWGYWGGKLINVTTRHIYDGYAWIVLSLKYLTGASYEDAVRYIALVYPAFVIALYIFAKVLFFKGKDNYPLLFGIIFLVAFGENGMSVIPSTQVYAYALISVAIVVRMFSESRTSVKYTTFYVLLALAGYIARANVPVFLMFAVTDLARVAIPSLWEKVTKVNEKRYLLINLSVVSLILISMIIILFIKTASTSGMFNYSLMIFRKQVNHFEWLVLASLLLIGFLSRGTERNIEIKAFKLVITMMFLSALMLTTVGSAFFPLYEINSDRMTEHMYMLSAAVVAFMVDPRRFFSEAQNASDRRNEVMASNGMMYFMPALALAMFLNNFTNYVLHMEVSHYRPFTADHYPTLITNDGPVSFYLAKNDQQVWGYMMRLDFERAPLLLDIETKSYSKSKVVDLLERGKEQPTTQ